MDVGVSLFNRTYRYLLLISFLRTGAVLSFLSDPSTYRDSIANDTNG